MTNYLKQILQSQFEAALCMLNQCIAACPPDHWESKIANGTFRWVAYHTLFFTDLYLSPSEHEFKLRDLHERGGDERGPDLSPGLSQEETLAYVSLCRQKLHDSLAAETRESLEGDSGFSYRCMTRGELYIYNLRHVQHHTGQLSAFLRKIDDGIVTKDELKWVGTGWKVK
jgi:hypothetical protein